MDELTPEALTQVMHATIPALGRLGIVADAAGPGSVTLRVPIQGNANHFGTMYAGALFAVVEVPGGLLPLAVVGPAYTPIVTDLSVQFLAPARTDVTVEARMDPAEVRGLAATADQAGSADFVLDLEARDESGRTVLTSQGRYQLRPTRR